MLTVDKEKIKNAFTIATAGHGHATQKYTVRRVDSSVPWPSVPELLLICDDGWDAYFNKSNPHHFGGNVSISGDIAYVDVYID